MPKRNQKMFNDIAAIISNNKKRHVQSHWSSGSIENHKFTLSDGERHEVSCGTSQCIAGWAVALSDEYYIDADYEAARRVNTNEIVLWEEVGAEILGLTEEEAERLFIDYPSKSEIPMGWPDALRAIGAGVDVEVALTQDVPRCEEK